MKIRPWIWMVLVPLLAGLGWLLYRGWQGGPILPQRLDITVVGETPDIESRAGEHRVRLHFVKLPGARDKGRVSIEIEVDGQLRQRVPAAYDYDLWQNEPAGYLSRDGADLCLQAYDHGPGPTYRIRARDGEVFLQPPPSAR